ncbi:SafA/ExsA family spore coat assembly protein [Virgibacillus oceani]
MKIHVVQKGDTLWEISQKYGVDFEEVKQLNSHLSSPDMIMPGMKIKVPTNSKAVKHESKPAKETKKEQVKQPYQDISPKPMPVIKEDDKAPPKKVQPEMPKMPQMPIQPIVQMPILEQDFDYHTTVKFPEKPKEPEVKKEKPKPQPVKEEKKVEAVMPPPQPMPMQMPMTPCIYMVHPCCPPAPYPMAAPALDQHQHPMGKHGKKDCGCQGTEMHYQNMMPYPVYGGVNNQNMMPNTMYGEANNQNMMPYPMYERMNNENMPHSSYTTPPNQQQQSNLYPPPFSPDMTQAYPSPPGYPQNYYRNDKEQTDNE